VVKICEHSIRNTQLSVKHFAGSNNLIEYDDFRETVLSGLASVQDCREMY